MMHPDDTRYLSLWLLLLALASVVMCAPSCSCGNDDDGFDCDFGQGTNRDGNLRSPVEACVLESPLSPRHIRDCVMDLEDDEIEWICACRPDQCEATRDFYDDIP